MSKRYIDADKLWNSRPQLSEGKSQDYGAGFCECMWGFSKEIKKQIDNPTADVVEVRHGEWETTPDYKPDILIAYRHICSVCKTTYKDIRPHGHKYCHECGAKMDGERREENEG